MMPDMARLSGKGCRLLIEHCYRQLRFLVLAGVLSLAGCAGLVTPPAPLGAHLQGPPEAAACAALFRAFDAQVAAAGVADAQNARIPGFPYLRGSRFLASFRKDPGADQWPVWLAALRELGHRGQQVELANLPDSEATWKALGVSSRAEAERRLEACGDRLLALDRQRPQVMALLRERSAVSDAYADYQRVLGLYPVTALIAGQGIRDLHATIRATFDRSPDRLPVKGELTDYTPPAADVARQPILDDYRTVPRDALGRPQLSSDQLDQLFRRHAPIWRIDVAQPADRIGAPYWDDHDRPGIDTNRPLVYRHTSHTRWRGETLLQLNYIIWFPARPLTGAFDLLGGHIDGITWRVTLDPEGEPLLYDAMHNCGCYHMAFPSAALRARERTGLWEEPLMVPALAPVIERGERVRLRIEQGSHYLQAVEAVTAYSGSESYSYSDYAVLRSLPVSTEQRRSLFNEHGIVPGSERLERWLLWPMGVPEPGAMRQWGTHATAFVGKRHFDDPDLIGRYFTAAP